MRKLSHMRFFLLLLSLMILTATIAGAVTFTGDGGMIVSGDGTDDFSVVDGVDSSYDYSSIVTHPPDEEREKGHGPTFAKSESFDIYLMMGDGSMELVDVVAVGSVNSVVKLYGETMTVNTCLLSYEIGEVEDEQRFAMVNAPKNGYATLHASANAKSAVVERIMTNRVALVLDVGKKYTRVWVDGMVGYLQTTSLTFLAGYRENTYLAKMSFNGKTKSRNTINIHMNGKSKSRILDDVICGTPMTVFTTTEDGWTEVETPGSHARLLSKYVTYDDLEIAAQ